MRRVSILGGPLLVLVAAAIFLGGEPGRPDRTRRPVVLVAGRSPTPVGQPGSVADRTAPATRPSPDTASCVPDAPGLDALATHVAGELWGGEGEPRLIDVRDQSGPGGRVGSRMYVFSIGREPLSKEALLARLDQGADPILWDDSVRCLEMGADEEHPPVIGHWTGLPPEYIYQHGSVERLSAVYGPREYRLVASHGLAAFPVLEFTDGDGSYFVEVTSGKTGKSFRLVENEGVVRSEKHRKRVEGFRAEWVRLLDRVRGS